MAVIGKIRKQSGLLVVIIGVALAAFILGDFTKRSQKHNMQVAVIEGEEISIQDFNKLFDENVEGTKRQRQTDKLNQDDLFRVRENTWTQILEKNLMGKEYEEIGMKVTSEELFDQITGANPHTAVIQNFSNPETGVFDRDMVINYLQKLGEMPQTQRDQWLNFEKYIKEDRLRNKYQNLVKQSFYLPQPIAKMIYHEKNDKATVRLVGVKYNTIADSTVKLTDDDYISFFNKNKKSYEREALREVDYVVFEIKPSEKDTRDAENFVKEMVTEFSQTPNIAAFVNANSDERYDSTWKARKEIPASIENIVFDQEIGFVYGPYLDNGSFKLVRLVDASMRPDSLKANHILITYKGASRSETNRTKEAAKSLADSLASQLMRSNTKFTAFAQTYSEDPSAKQNNGDIGWFRDGQMVPEFNQYVVDNKIGTIGVVETMFGYHVIEVTGKKEAVKKIRLATVTRLVTPSTQTAQDIFAQASKFATMSKTKADFDKAVEKESLNKRVAPNLKMTSSKITGVENARQIIRWAFMSETEVGDVSTIFDLDNMYVVASLTKSTEKGIPDWKEMKDVLRTQVMNTKKGQMLVEEMKAAGTSDFEALASRFKTQAQDINGIAFESRVLTGFGQESKVIGDIFALSTGDQIGPIDGTGAAYMIQLRELVTAAERDTYESVVREKANSFNQTITSNSVLKAIEKVSDVTDNRVMFY